MVRCGLFSLARLGRGEGSGLSFLPRPFGEKAGVRGEQLRLPCCEIDNRIYLIHLKSVNPRSKI